MNLKNFLCKGSLSTLLSLLCASCAIYETDFDCPPDMGIPCTSSSEIEKMVIEKEEGADIFLGEGKPISCVITSIPSFSSLRNCSTQKRVWICSHLTRSGYQVQGHYVYQPAEACLDRDNIEWNSQNDLFIPQRSFHQQGPDFELSSDSNNTWMQE